jgi:hypothetical protein
MHAEPRAAGSSMACKGQAVGSASNTPDHTAAVTWSATGGPDTADPVVFAISP